MPLDNHYLPVPFKFADKSTFILAKRPNPTSTKAAIFVHGFWGSSTGTWGDFPSELPNQVSLRNYDFLFYGYDYRHQRARYTALALYELLDQFFERSRSVTNAHLLGCPPRDPFTYEQVTLVAHSLGAIICRLALLEGCRNGKTWPSKTQLVLFAPAHMGAPIVTIGKDAAASWLPTKLIGGALEWDWPTLLDLTPGSKTLDMLHERVNKIVGANACLKATKIIRGSLDGIVDPNDFDEDPTPVVFYGKDHLEVCKPSKDFGEPLRELIKVL